MISDEEYEHAIAAAIAFRLNPVKWIGGDGVKTYDVSEMTDSHIENTLNMIASGRMKRQVTNGLRREQWCEIFLSELIARRNRP